MLCSQPRPTAIFAANDILAKAVYEEARKCGLRIPGDLSVLGFADLGFASSMTPPLSSFDQKAQEIGRHAVELLLAHVNAGEATEGRCEIRMVTPTLVLRSSTNHLLPV